MQSVHRALDIIERLSGASKGMRLKSLAIELGLTPQTTQSLLRTLQMRRWVTQGGRGTPYCLGPAAHDVSRRWLRRADRAILARPVVADLSRKLGEYVLLAEWRGGALTRLVEISPENPLMVAPFIETSGSLHTMATARVLLAHLDKADLEQTLASIDFAPKGPQTIKNARTLIGKLKETRKKGYSLCIREAAEGCAAAAVPVRNDVGNVAAALGVALPLVRFAEQRRKQILAQLKTSAAALSQIWIGLEPEEKSVDKIS